MGAVILFHDFAQTSIDPLQFSFSQLEELVSCLRQRGYSFGAPQHAAQPKASHLVAVTIDDGFASSLQATEILQRHGIRPTIFVNPGELGGTNTWRRNSTFNARVITATELRTLSSLADVGHHGWKHRSVLSISVARFIVESLFSLAWFGLYLGLRPRLFAYPFGEADYRTFPWVSRFFESAFLVSLQDGDSNLGIARYEIFAGKKTSTLVEEIAAHSQLVERTAVVAF